MPLFPPPPLRPSPPPPSRLVLPEHFTPGAPLYDPSGLIRLSQPPPAAPEILCAEAHAALPPPIDPPAGVSPAEWAAFIGAPDPDAAMRALPTPARTAHQNLARRILAHRELARRNYRDFLQYWMLATRQRLRWGWFHDLIADLMQSVTLRQRRRCIVNIPPRHLKSTLISQMWHPWLIGRDDGPDSALMSLAATATLAARDSRRSLDVLRSDWYAALFPHVQLTRENEVEWETQGGAYRIAVGRGGTVTGRGGDHICIAEGTPVLTRSGWVPIGVLLPGDEVATPLGYRRVTAVMDNGVRPVVKLRAGRFSLLLTPTHKCSTPTGWREARAFQKGDEVHALPPDHPSLRELRALLHVRSTVPVLQQAVCGSQPMGGANSRAEMPGVRGLVPPTGAPDGAETGALQQEMSQHSEDTLRCGQSEPELQARQAGGVLVGVSSPDFAHPTGCSDGMRDVRRDEITGTPDGSASSQREQAGRHPGEPSGAVRLVPSVVASAPAPAGEARVFDLTVEEAHCFYAGGVLVHNCVDDLILSDEANSETIRDKCNEWLGETLASRLNDPRTGTITIIMQRFHELDPTGYLLSRMKIPGADQYEHIVLPMEATKRTIVTLDGEIYATREPGDLLDPGRIGPEEVAALKVSMRLNYDGQYQQDPCKQAGGMLDPSRLIEIEGTTPELIQRFGLVPNFYLDFATREKETQKDDPDYSSILVAAKDQLGRMFFLDQYARQTAYDELARTLIGMHRAYHPRFVKGEKGGLINTFQPILSMTQKMVGHFFPILPFKGPMSKGDKIHRASTFQGMLNAGMICVPKNAPWLDALKSEMRAFPKGVHDDRIDGCSMACNDAEDVREGEAPIMMPTDERTLMDEDHKRRLQQMIEQERRGEASYCDSIDDW